MHRRIIAVVFGGLCVVSVIAVYLATRPAPADVTLLYPREPSDHLLWPTNRSWVWSVNLPESQDKALAVVARVVHQPLAKGESPTIESRWISQAESKTEITMGKMLPGKQPVDTALVSVQLIDLREVGAPVEKEPLRLMLRLRCNGSTAWTGESVIPGDKYVGQSAHPQPWANDELHLQNLFVQEGDRLAIYDIVVVQSRSSTGIE